MKKIIAILLAILFVVALIGCKKEKLMVETETVYAEQTPKLQAGNAIAQAGKLEKLSEEDITVKTELSKYSDTKVDFRNNKIEEINGKTYSVKFEKIDDLEDVRVIYTNEFEDEFAYDINSGKLRYAVMKSSMTEKNSKSINKETAEKIAKEYVVAKCDLNVYILDYYKEIETGYYFSYNLYIGGYPSVARYGVQVGYDGAIVYVSDFTDAFDGININYDKASIDAEINKILKDESIAELTGITILAKNGKLNLFYTAKYYSELGHEQSYTVVHPLE